jgi:hypothetical protein
MILSASALRQQENEAVYRNKSCLSQQENEALKEIEVS